MLETIVERLRYHPGKFLISEEVLHWEETEIKDLKKGDIFRIWEEVNGKRTAQDKDEKGREVTKVATGDAVRLGISRIPAVSCMPINLYKD